MTETISITAEPRGRAGKGTARQTRRSGRIPAVIYGNKEKPVLISVEYIGFERILHRPGFFTHLFDIAVDGATHRVLPRDVQVDPISDKPIHIDFLRVSTDALITVSVPVEFVNGEKSPGLRRGGTLNIVRHEVEVQCRADAIPAHLTVDLEGFDLNDSIHISAVKLPEGVSPTITDRDFTVATIAVPSGVKSEAAEATPTEGGAA